MVRFKSWKDNYIFLRDFCNCSCLNCYYGGVEYSNDDETHTDSEYAHLFCRESISMVRLDFMFLCAKWRDKDSGKQLEEIGNDNMFSLTERAIDILDKDDKEWSIDEIRSLINELEEQIE